MKAVFVKLGGSLITDKTKPYSLRPDVIRQISQEIATIRQQQPDLVWFIGNGAGSFGHYAVHEVAWRDQPGDSRRIAYVRKATGKLNAAVLEALLDHDVPALSLPAAAFAYHDGKTIQIKAEAVLRYAQQDAVPSVYGDVIVHSQQGSVIMSTEEILSGLASAWRAAGHDVKSVIYCTSVDGVLDSKGKTISKLSKSNQHASFHDTEGYDVTGGMAQKVQAGFAALDFTDNVYIINGTKKGQLAAALDGLSAGTQLTL